METTLLNVFYDSETDTYGYCWLKKPQGLEELYKIQRELMGLLEDNFESIYNEKKRTVKAGC